MRSQSLGALLFISIDLPSTPLEISSNRPARTLKTAGRVLEHLNAAGMSATWFTNDPVGDPTLAQALAAGIGHVAGLRVDDDGHLADSSPLTAARSRLVAEILARTARARCAGISISTVALGEAAAAPAELLGKYGFTAVRSPARDASPSKNAAGILPLRYGLWLVSPDFVLTGPGRISEWRSASRIRCAIDRSIRNQASLHLAVDIAAISSGNGADRLGGLPGIVRHIEGRRQAGLLRVCPIAAAISQLSGPAPVRASGSILRAA
ncbi:MAG TPA: hypothetical protein VHX65_09125 [Pirellulales bacterium]|jgi:hypothetical protein|nr:hypothetical protein [Pirellulales bacterium]